MNKEEQAKYDIFSGMIAEYYDLVDEALESPKRTSSAELQTFKTSVGDNINESVIQHKLSITAAIIFGKKGGIAFDDNSGFSLFTFSGFHERTGVYPRENGIIIIRGKRYFTLVGRTNEKYIVSEINFKIV